MKRIISYICIGFVCLFFVSLSVNAAIVFDSFDLFVDKDTDFFININDTFNYYYDYYSQDFNVCFRSPYYSTSYSYYFNCSLFSSNISVYNSYFSFKNNSLVLYSFGFDDEGNLISTWSNEQSSYINSYLLTSDGYSWLFWTADSYFTNSGNYIISDEDYSSISDFYKNYYNFQNLVVVGEPLYSIINLVLGNWSGYESSVDIINCYDGVCDNFVYKSISYNYGVENTNIDLSDVLEELVNGYTLDTSYDYTIFANNTERLYVYYYGDSYSYSVNFYLDDIFNEDLSYSSYAYIGSVITITDLDEVIDNIYFLQDDDYSIILSSTNNEINIYYYSIEVTYSVNFYLDDIYYQAYSYSLIDKVGNTITLDNLEEVIDIYNLQEDVFTITLVAIVQ